MYFPSKKTKIVCTIGPASESKEVLVGMIKAGMNVARLNFAHGDFESHARVIENIREGVAQTGLRVALMGDLPGPKIRIGQLAEEPVELERGQPFILQTNDIVGDNRRASLSFRGLPSAVQPGDEIYINDGFIQLRVDQVKGDEVHCLVKVGGPLLSHKGVNFPGIDLGISAFTDRDRELLSFAAEQKLDAISQSFVQCPEDVEAVRSAALALDYKPFLIAKIERSQALKNLNDILAVTDGIMVARGDLGVEIPIEEIAATQKRMIRQANLCSKPVITATHMLESMTVHSRPTRAEVTDVANAILDGTDCVMLSGETAMGTFPVEAVATMTRIAQVTEPEVRAPDLPRLLRTAKASGEISHKDLVSLSICLTVSATDPVAVVTPTLSGSTARRLARFRLKKWIVAVSPNESTCQALQFSYGVDAVHERGRPESWQTYTRDWLAEHGLTEGLAILTHGSGTVLGGGTNQIEIVDLGHPPDDLFVW
jgi:pyruvate kinase